MDTLQSLDFIFYNKQSKIYLLNNYLKTIESIIYKYY